MFDAPDANSRTERHLLLLQELSELGMKLARAMTEQAAAQAADQAPSADPGLVFSRIARAVRLTIALEAKLADELSIKVRKAQAQAAEEAEDAARAPLIERQAKVRRAVARAIRLDVSDSEDEDLLEALEDQLHDWSQDEAFLNRPIGDLVARICRDLGVTANPSLWDDEDWAIQERSGTPPPDDAEGGEAQTSEAARSPQPPHCIQSEPALTERGGFGVLRSP